jgi:hypothetical protein
LAKSRVRFFKNLQKSTLAFNGGEEGLFKLRNASLFAFFSRSQCVPIMFPLKSPSSQVVPQGVPNGTSILG